MSEEIILVELDGKDPSESEEMYEKLKPYINNNVVSWPLYAKLLLMRVVHVFGVHRYVPIKQLDRTSGRLIMTNQWMCRFCDATVNR